MTHLPEKETKQSGFVSTTKTNTLTVTAMRSILWTRLEDQATLI
jgi:hypothetical protein